MNAFISYIYLSLQNIEYFGLLLVIFLAVAFTAAAACLFLINSNSSRIRLRHLLSPSSASSGKKPKIIEEDDDGGMLSKLARPLHPIVEPGEVSSKKKLKLKLLQAGFRSQRAYANYLSMKIFCTLCVVILCLFTTTSLYKFNAQTILALAALGAIGFLLPDICLDYLVHRRKRHLTRVLPDALDLMVLCVEAGLGLDMTLKRVGEEMMAISPALSGEFSLTNLEIRAGRSRDESFRNMSMRTGVPEINNLMTVLSQTSRFGTSVAKALRIHSESMRIRRRQYAEERAAKSAVKLILPLILFIFPAIFVVLVGPAAIKIMNSIFITMGG